MAVTNLRFVAVLQKIVMAEITKLLFSVLLALNSAHGADATFRYTIGLADQSMSTTTSAGADFTVAVKIVDDSGNVNSQSTVAKVGVTSTGGVFNNVTAEKPCQFGLCYFLISSQIAGTQVISVEDIEETGYANKETLVITWTPLDTFQLRLAPIPSVVKAGTGIVLSGVAYDRFGNIAIRETRSISASFLYSNTTVKAVPVFFSAGHASRTFIHTLSGAFQLSVTFPDDPTVFLLNRDDENRWSAQEVTIVSGKNLF